MINDIQRNKSRLGRKPKIVDTTYTTEKDPETVQLDESIKTEDSTKTKKRFLAKPLTKKEKWFFIGGVSAVLIVVLGLFSYYMFYPHHRTISSVTLYVKPKATPTPTPPQFISRLTGMPVTQAQSVLPVTAVMVENSTEARPQSGLSDAGIIFEAMAEGGVTRFMALYEEGNPPSIGPVRSARPYFIDWMLPFNAGYAHAGGSPQGLAEIAQYNVRDLDEFYNGSSYTRITTREAPHNLYTSMSSLLALEQSKGYTTSTFTGFPRKADQPTKTPNATVINMTFSGPDFNDVFTYTPKTNNYERNEGGQPQIDANTGLQLDPKVVIAMIVPYSNGPLDSSGAYYTDYSDIGSGQVEVFQDGTMTPGTWEKSSASSQLQFIGTNGKPITLDAGQVWISAIENSGDVSYSS